VPSNDEVEGPPRSADQTPRARCFQLARPKFKDPSKRQSGRELLKHDECVDVAQPLMVECPREPAHD
jgi:hypothetical protein